MNHCAAAAKSKYDQSLARSFDRRLIGSNLKQKRSPPPSFLFSLRTLLWTTPSESPLMKNNPAMETCRQFHVVSPPQWYLITLPYAFAHCKILFQLGSFAYSNQSAGPSAQILDQHDPCTSTGPLIMSFLYGM